MPIIQVPPGNMSYSGSRSVDDLDHELWEWSIDDLSEGVKILHIHMDLKQTVDLRHKNLYISLFVLTMFSPIYYRPPR